MGIYGMDFIMTNNKNVFLVDGDLDILDAIYLNPNINVLGVCVDRNTDVMELRVKYPDTTIYTIYDIIGWDKTHVSEADIKTYAKTQLKCERDSARYITGFGSITSLYYHSLAFWLHIFNSNKIECLIVGGLEHGSITDSIPLDIAVSYKIPAYTLDPLYANPKHLYSGIRNHATTKYINLEQLLENKDEISISEIMDQNKQYTESNVVSRINKITNKKLRNITDTILECLSVFLKSICGVKGIKLIKLQLRIYDILYKGYFWLQVVLNKNYDIKRGMPREIRYRNLAKQLHSLKKRNRYYSSHADSSISSEKNSVVYALHFEPEASIMNRTTYNSQIYNITMLSHSLPRDWILYIKEHPHQIKNIYNSDNFWYLHKLDNYRSQEYYSQLLELPNVRLLDYNITSDMLLSSYNQHEKGLKAIATINGTISLEALEKNVPVLLFDIASTAYSKGIPNLYAINDYSSLLTSISHISNIQKNPVIDDKSDLSKITEYVFRRDSDNIGDILINLISKLPVD